MQTIQTAQTNSSILTDSISVGPNGFRTFYSDGVSLLTRFQVHVDDVTPEAPKPSKLPEVITWAPNAIQESMLDRLILGLPCYTQEEVRNMGLRTRTKISRDWYRANRVLAEMKYERVYGPIDKIFFALSQAGYLGAQGDPLRETTPESDRRRMFKIEPTLREAGVPLKEACQKLIDEKLLPADFFSIDPTKPPVF